MRLSIWRRWASRLAQVFVLLALTAAAPPAAADPGDPVQVDDTVVSVVGGVVSVAEGPLLVLPLVNTTAAPLALGGQVFDAPAPADLAPGAPVAEALLPLGIDPASVNWAWDAVSSENCSGSVLDPGARCEVRLRSGAAVRPAALRLSWRDAGDTQQVFTTFVVWPAGTDTPLGDLLSDAAEFDATGFFPSGVGTVSGIQGATHGMGAEIGEQAHAGRPAARSWWHRLRFNDTGRLQVTVQATAGPGGAPAGTGIRAAIYRAPAGNDPQPPVTSLLPIGTAASAQSPTGTVVVSAPVGPQISGYADVYYLAVDDLGAPTDFTVEATLGVGDISFDPPSGLVPVTAAGPPQPGIVVYNAGPGDLFVDLPAMTSFQVAEASSPDGRCWASDPLPSSGPVIVTVEAGGVCTLAFAVDPLAAPAPGQTVEEGVTLTASGPAALSGTYTLRATGIGGGGGPTPANDLFASAEDISSLSVPAYVPGPNGQPSNTVQVTGTTLGSTREPLEYGTTLNPDGSETPPPNGTVWYRFTSPPGGFSGRLGYRATPGFFVTPIVMKPSVTVPSPADNDAQFARGNTWPPSSLPFVRMEPGHTVWFQVSAVLNDSTAPPSWSDGDFTLELFQAPNEQDDIALAYDVNGADVFDGTGRPWADPFNWSGDGDTHHTTPDQPGGPPTMWFTATFDRPGFWSFRARSEDAGGGPSDRPLSIRLYRSPTSVRVADPAVLGDPVAAADGAMATDPYSALLGWVTALAEVPVTPGRYYWSVDQGAGGPTFYGLFSTFSSLRAAVATVTDCSGAPVGMSGGPSAAGGSLYALSLLAAPGVDFFASASYDLTARLASAAADASGDAEPTVCAPSASVTGELRVERDFGATDPVPVPVRVLADATASGDVGEVAGVGDLRVQQALLANVTVTDPDTLATVLTYESRLDRTLVQPADGSTGAAVSTTWTRLDGGAVPGVPDTDVPTSLSCAGSPLRCPANPGLTTLTPGAVAGTALLQPGKSYRYRVELQAPVSARSADVLAGAPASALVDASRTLAVALTAPAGTTLRCSTGRYCPSTLPGEPRDQTAPDTSIDAPAYANGQDVVIRFGATEGNVTYECETSIFPGFRSCPNPLAIPGVPEGALTVRARATDAAFNADPTPAEATIVVDRTPPVATITTPADGATYPQGSVPSTAVTACTDAGSGIAASAVLVDGVGTSTLAATPGPHTVALSCTDQAGNTAAANATYTVTAADQTPPVIAIAGVDNGGMVTTANPTLTISSDEPLYGIICNLETPTPGGGTSSNDIGCLGEGTTGGTLTLPDLPDGLVTLRVFGRDAAGNDGQASISFEVVAPPVATITAPTDGGTYFTDEVPFAVAYACVDNGGVISAQEVQLVPQGGGPPTLLAGAAAQRARDPHHPCALRRRDGRGGCRPGHVHGAGASGLPGFDHGRPPGPAEERREGHVHRDHDERLGLRRRGRGPLSPAAGEHLLRRERRHELLVSRRRSVHADRHARAGSAGDRHRCLLRLPGPASRGGALDLPAGRRRGRRRRSW